MWDVYTRYASPEPTPEAGNEDHARKFSLASAWGGLHIAQQHNTLMETDEPALMRSIFDLWKGPDVQGAAAELPFVETALTELATFDAPSRLVSGNALPEEAISVFGIWGDYLDKRPPTQDVEAEQVAPPTAPPRGKARKKRSELSTSKQAKPKKTTPDQPKAETSLFNAWNELYSGQALLEIDLGEQQPLIIGPDPILHPQQHPSAFRQWGDVLRAGLPTAASEAGDAYFRQMIKEGLPGSVMSRREQLLGTLQLLLKGQSRQPATYRQVVSVLLQRCSDADHDSALACARDYYYFWLGDLRYRPSAVVGRGVTIRSLKALSAAPFLNLLKRMRQEARFPMPPSLSIYLGQLHENGRSASELDSREILLKALLYFLQNESFVPSCYRRAVDTLLLHIALPEERASVVSLAREFFYYWIAFPPAATRNELIF
jgi:hypothetical protein